MKRIYNNLMNLFKRSRVNFNVNTRIKQSLNSIPSETSELERVFLYNFMRTFWDGKSNVVEFGPFLGGTTRALIIGMLDNPRRLETIKLKTIDAFKDYYSAEEILRMFGSDVRNLQKARTLLESKENLDAQFIDIFRLIHQNSEYYKYLEICTFKLPDYSQEALRLQDVFEPNTGVFFVDACKSWYSTKWFISESSKTAISGAYYLFQDYGHYTCFWIPFILYLMNQKYIPVCSVDTTQVFVLNDSITSDDLKCLEDTPDGYSKDSVISVFNNLIQEARLIANHDGVFILEVQKAAMLAYIGEKELAKAHLKSLKKTFLTKRQRRILSSASISPTYTPAGKILLDSK